jgi:hypothetical protein
MSCPTIRLPALVDRREFGVGDGVRDTRLSRDRPAHPGHLAEVEVAELGHASAWSATSAAAVASL